MSKTNLRSTKLIKEDSQSMQQQNIRFHNDGVTRVSGIKFLNSTTTYLITVIVALCLYQIDQRWPLGEVFDSLRTDFAIFKIQNIDPLRIDSLIVLAFTIVVICLILAIKTVVQRKRAAKNSTELQNSEDNTASASSEEFEHLSQYVKSQYADKFTAEQSPVHACEKITQDEYNYQSQVLTKQEILKLRESKAYKDAMRAKGSDLSNWNWQTYEEKNGGQPGEDSKQVNAEIDLEEELQKIDEQLNPGQQRSSAKKMKSRAAINKTEIVVKDQQPLYEKNDKLGSPIRNKKYLRTPSTNHTLRSSPHITRSVNQKLY